MQMAKISRKELRTLISEQMSMLDRAGLKVQDMATGGEKLDNIGDFLTTGALDNALAQVGSVDQNIVDFDGNRIGSAVRAALFGKIVELANEGGAMDPGTVDDYFQGLADYVRKNATLMRK